MPIPPDFESMPTAEALRVMDDELDQCLRELVAWARRPGNFQSLDAVISGVEEWLTRQARLHPELADKFNNAVRLLAFGMMRLSRELHSKA